MTKLDDLQQPLNSMERFLYAIAVRQNIIIEQNNSIIEHLAKRDNVATTNNVSDESPIEATIAAVEAPKPAPRKRAPRKKVEETKGEE